MPKKNVYTYDGTTGKLLETRTIDVADEQPTADERVAALEAEVRTLKAALTKSGALPKP